MAADSEGTITVFFGQLRAGDRSAAQGLWEYFFPRLLGLARKTLASSSQRVTDADDAVQSAFISFWQSVERGDLTGEIDRDNLWSFLSVITVRKALNYIEKEGAQKRGGGKVHGESSAEAWFKGQRMAFKLDDALGQVPAHDFDLHCEELLLRLDEESRPLAVMRLMGYTHKEIADILDCTERTVRRKIKLIRLTWEQDGTEDL